MSAAVVAATAVVAAAVITAAVEAATCRQMTTSCQAKLFTLLSLRRQQLHLRHSPGAGCCSTMSGSGDTDQDSQLLPSSVRTSQCASSPARRGSRKATGCALLRRHAQSARSNSRSPARPCTPPVPNPTDLHMLPHHAIAGIHSGCDFAFAALPACGAAPVLLLRGPGLKCGTHCRASLAARMLGRNCSRLRCSRMGPCQQPALHSRPPGQAGGSA